MNLRLKDKPLAVQIWIILGMVLGISLAVLVILFPLVLRVSFTGETYDRIADAQEYIIEQGRIDALHHQSLNPLRIKINPEVPPPPFDSQGHC